MPIESRALGAYFLPLSPIENYSSQTGAVPRQVAPLIEIAAKIYARAGDFDQAFKVTDGVSDDLKAESLVEIAKAYINLGEFEQISVVAGKISNEYIRVNTLLEKIVTSTAAYTEQSSILAEVLKAAQQITQPEPKIQILTKIVENTQNQALLKKVLEITRQIYSSELKSTLITEIAAKIYTIFGNFEEVLEIIKDKNAQDFRSKILAEVAEIAQNFNVLNKVLEMNNESIDNDSKLRVLTGVAQGYANLGDFDKALEMASKMPKESFCLKILSKIAVCAQSPNIFDQALEMAKNIGNKINQARVLCEIAQGYANLGDFDKALEVIQSCNEGPKLETLVKIVEKTQDSTYVTKIIEMVAKMSDQDNEKADTLAEVTEYITNPSCLAQILNIAEKIPNKAQQSTVLLAVAKTYIKTNNFEGALEIVPKTNDVKQSKILAEVAQGYANLGQFDKALGTVNKIVQIYNSQSDTLAEIATVYVKMDDFDKALEIAKKCDWLGSSQVLIEIGKKLAEDYQTKANALKLFPYFQRKVQPLLADFTLSLQVELIDSFIENLPKETFITLAKDLSNTNVESIEEITEESSSEPKIPSPREKLKKLANQNLYLISKDKKELYNQILAILNISIKTPTEGQAGNNLNAVRGGLVQQLTQKNSKISQEDFNIKQASRLLHILVTKDPQETFRYVEKYLLHITKLHTSIDKQETRSQKNLQKYLQFFLGLAANYGLLSYKWKVIINDKNCLMNIYKLLKNKNKEDHWSLESLNSLIISLAQDNKNNFLSDITKKPKLIKLCLEHNIISPNLYKIVRITPENNWEEILESLSQIKKNIFITKQPSLQPVLDKLYNWGIGLEEAENWNQECLLEIIVYTFGLSGVNETRKSLKELLAAQQEVNAHLTDCDLSNTPDIVFAKSNMCFQEGETANTELIEMMEKAIRQSPNTEKKPEHSKLLVAKLMEENQTNKLVTLKDTSLTKLINLLSLDPILFDKISKITIALKNINLGDLKNDISAQNNYHNLLNLIQETFGIVLRDRCNSWIAQLQREGILNKDLTDKSENKLQESLMHNFGIKIINPLKKELKKFREVLTDDEEKCQTYCEKNIISFFAKAGAELCTSTDTRTWIELENHFHINIVLRGKLVANVQVYKETVNGKKCLVLRGLNPTNEFLKTVSAENFVKNLFNFSKNLAKQLGFDGPVYLTESLKSLNWDAHSNRSEVRKYLEETVYAITKPVNYEMHITTSQKVKKLYPI